MFFKAKKDVKLPCLVHKIGVNKRTFYGSVKKNENESKL